MKKKKSIIISLVLVILIGPSSAYAIETEATLKDKYLINSTEELVEEFKLQSENGELKSEESEAILESTEPEIIKEYNDYLKEEVTSAMQELSSKSEIQFDINNPEETNKVSQVELDDGTIVELTETIGDVDHTISKFNSIFNIASITGTHSYGSRYYQCKYNVKFVAYPDTVCSLYTYFNASKSGGLTATSSSTAGSTTFVPTTLAKSSKVTDSRAEKVGWDINAQGDYNATVIGYNGVGVMSWDVTMISTVKLDALNSTTYTSTAWNTVYR